MHKCPECGNQNIAYENSEISCRDCGLVIEDNEIEQPYISEGTQLHATHPYLTRAGSQPVEGRIYKSAWMLSTREKNLQMAVNKIDLVTSRLKIPEFIKKEATLIFKKSLYSNIAKSTGINSIIYASIYIACNIHGIPKTPLEITAYTEIDIVQLIYTYKKIKKTLDIKTKPIDPIDILPRFASNLGLTQQTITLTAEILNKMRESGKFEGRKPETILAGAIYVASKKTGEIKTQRKIANTLGIIEATIRKISKEIICSTN